MATTREEGGGSRTRLRSRRVLHRHADAGQKRTVEVVGAEEPDDRGGARKKRAAVAYNAVDASTLRARRTRRSAIGDVDDGSCDEDLRGFLPALAFAGATATIFGRTPEVRRRDFTLATFSRGVALCRRRWRSISQKTADAPRTVLRLPGGTWAVEGSARQRSARPLRVVAIGPGASSRPVRGCDGARAVPRD